jgi:DNA/RNA-binding domain of Phe-tRNA-synthetase-like protein
MLIVSESWKRTYPGASVGILAMQKVVNPERHPLLDDKKASLEATLRTKFAAVSREELIAQDVFKAYEIYYSQFKKTYHVLLQLESIVKGKSIPQVAALVEAMFMAELENQLLTAGHDLDAIEGAVQLEVSTGEEKYLLMSGKEQVLKPNDMFIADEQAAISSIIYGPDGRTRIRQETQKVLFTVYAPPGIDPQQVRAHLEIIQGYVRVVAPNSEVQSLEIYTA